MKDKEFLVSKGVNVDKSLELFGDLETYTDSLKHTLAEFQYRIYKSFNIFESLC